MYFVHRHVTHVRHTGYCPHFILDLYTVCILKNTGHRIFAVCVEHLYKRDREADINKESDLRCYSGQI